MQQTKQSSMVLFWKTWLKSRLARLSFIYLSLLIGVAFFAPLLANDLPLFTNQAGKWFFPAFETNYQVPEQAPTFSLYAPIRYKADSYDLDAILASPSKKHLLGTDAQGKDIAAQMIWGAKTSLAVGVIAVGISALLGIFFGSIAGYFGGWFDLVISRFIEVVMCFPTFFLILSLLAFVGPSMLTLMVVIGLTSWTTMARLVRAEMFKLKTQNYVQASIILGSSHRRIIVRHLLPNIMPSLLVLFNFGMAAAILAEAALSFLGFGVAAYEPSWG